MFGISSLLRALLGNQPLFTIDVGGVDLRVVRFQGQEGISSLFRFRLELAGPEIDVAALVDKAALLRIEGVDSPRFVHGILSEFEYVGETRSLQLYEAELVPWIWRLQHRHDCRIFQDKPTPKILEEVLTKAGLAKDWLRFALVAEYTPRNYCVQYRETDLAFICRLMEEDGIFYFFEHENDKHVLVMADHPGAHKQISGSPAIWFNPPGGDVTDREHIHKFRFGQRIKPGKASYRDFNLHKPDLPMEVNETGKLNADLEVYHYPGEYQDPALGTPDKGGTIAKARLEAHQTFRRSGGGTSDCPRLTAGHTFDLIGHYRSDFDTTYRITHVSHAGNQPQALDQDASGEFSYSNEFGVTERVQAYRSAQQTPKPQMRGLQTATVVGPEGEEIYPDEHGRVKVQFHWDRPEPFDETSSCWVRVSQVWAGAGWGAMFIPRIGHEVLVDFIEGDPDRPIVVGRIYTGNNRPPYPLPAEKTKSTIKSESSLGGAGYNELRYEDLKGGEQIFFHAERNLDTRVNNDSFEGVSNDKHVTVGRSEEKAKAGDQFVQLYRDHHHVTHRNTQMHLGGDIRLRVGGIDGPGRVDLRVESDMFELIEGQHHEHVIKDEFVAVGGSVSRTVGGDEQVKIGGRQAVEVKDEIHLKAPKIVVEASQGVTIQGPGGFITIDSGGIVIRGTMVKINSGGSALSGEGSEPGLPQDAAIAAPNGATEAEFGSKRGRRANKASSKHVTSGSESTDPTQRSMASSAASAASTVDRLRPSLAWDPQLGGLKLTWEVLDNPLQSDVTIEVYFADGPGHANRLGGAVFEHVVPAGTAVGQGKPAQVSGQDLDDAPAGTTHLIATGKPNDLVGSIADVGIAFGANAAAGAVSAGMTKLVKDGLRAAGAAMGTISSTARSPADQARAMFANLVNTGAAAQMKIYRAPGQAVIRAYIAETQNLTPAQIQAQSARIQQVMTAEINAQGPANVSKHCSDPAVRSVVDVSQKSFNAKNRNLFFESVSKRATKVLDEPNNNCFHLELAN